MPELRFVLKDNYFVAANGTTEYQLIDFGNNFSDMNTEYLKHTIVRVLNSFNTVSKYTMSDITQLDICVMVCCIFNYLLNRSPQKIRMLEIGDSFGCTSFFSDTVIKLFSKDNVLYCCNSWLETSESPNKLSSCIDTLSFFRGIMRYFGTSENMVLLAGDLESSMDALQENYYDIILICDGDQYKPFINYIVNSIKVIKPGGFLIGYNCECYFRELPEEIRKKQSDSGEYVDGTYHTGVITALERLFAGEYLRPIPYSSVWVKPITADTKRIISERFGDSERNKTADRILKLLNEITESLSVDGTSYNASALIKSGSTLMKLEKLLSSEKYEKDLRHMKLLTANAVECHLDILKAIAEPDKPHVMDYLQKEKNILKQIKDRVNIFNKGGNDNE